MGDKDRVGPRLAIVLPTHWSALRGGAELQVRYLLERAAGHPWGAIRYFAGDVAPGFSAESYSIEDIGRGGSGRRARLAQSVRLYGALRRFQPHVIYQRVGCAYTGIAARYARASGARMVWHIAHESDVTPETGRLDRPFRYLEKRMLEYGLARAGGVVAQTTAQARLLEQHYGRNDANVIRNFHHVPEPTELRRGTPTVLWIANYKPWKRPEVFIELARRLRHLNAEFRMIGRLPASRSRADQLLELVESAGNVRHLGSLAPEEVDGELDRADLLVNTSVAEGFSNTFIQAWMRSVPVYTLGVNPDELISEHRLGCVADDLEQLVSAVERGLQQRSELNSAGQRAREFAVANFSLNNADRLLDYLLEDAEWAASGLNDSSA